VDSRFHILKYVGATLVTPNETEAAPAVGMQLDSAKEIKDIGLKLLEKIQGKDLPKMREQGCFCYSWGRRGKRNQGMGMQEVQMERERYK